MEIINTYKYVTKATAKARLAKISMYSSNSLTKWTEQWKDQKQNLTKPLEMQGRALTVSLSQSLALDMEINLVSSSIII